MRPAAIWICALALALTTPPAAAAALADPPAELSETKERVTYEQMEALVAVPLRLAQDGDMPAADRALDRLLDQRRRRFGANSVEVADTLTAFMVMLNVAGLERESMAYRVRTLDAVRQAWGSDHVEYALILNDLVNMDLELNEDAVAPEAEGALLEAYRIRRERLGEMHKETIATLIYLGEIQGLQSRTGGHLSKAGPALATLRKAIADAQSIYAPGYDDELWARTTLACVFARNGALGPALQTFEKMTEIAAAGGSDLTFCTPSFAKCLEEGGFKAEAGELTQVLVRGLGLIPDRVVVERVPEVEGREAAPE